MMVRSALLNVMMGAARKAARSLVRDYGEIENLQVSRKGPSDFVSSADIKVEKTLRQELKKARPAYGFLMEEGGEIIGDDRSNRWIVDPIDGTTNFLHGIPNFCISIALEREGELIAGVIYQPLGDEMFHAEKGAGAFLNERRLRVSARRKLEDSVLATGIPFHGRGGHEPFLRELGAVMKNVAGVRRFGSAALDLAYVAAGRCDGYWEAGIKPWDIAAGIVLVREAGGYVTDYEGGNKLLETGEIIAGNDHLHQPLLRLIKSAHA
ncbi:inositol monophosphatase family protein [Magnetospirillum molischianum]|uniref:inositol monophosphatase family protein n=1 Tax=Magnetospirillum molischianum TaxID=1083 RepID=UPI0002E04235|nr:inositol monophosphatase family protein [Magnetospirillum molischianum]